MDQLPLGEFKFSLLKPKIFEFIGFSIALLPWMVMCLVLMPRVTFGSENLRVLEAMPLGRDQAHVAAVMWGGWKTGAPIFYGTYGNLYYNIAWIILKVLSLLIPITEQSVIIALRFINLVSFFGVGLFSYLWMRKRFGILTGSTFSLLLFSLSRNNDFVLRATVSQHDTIHLFVILLTFLATLDLGYKFSKKHLIVLSILTGAVMSIKYSGFIFFPIIVYILLIHAVSLNIRTIKNFINTSKIILRKILILTLLILSFLIVIEQISPTTDEGRSIYRLLFFPNIWILKEVMKFAIFILLSLIVFRLLSSKKRLVFWINSLVFYTLIFSLAFQALSARSLFRLEFIDALILRKDVFIYFKGGPLAWFQLILHDTLGSFLFVIFILGTIISIFHLVKYKIRAANKYQTVAFIWVWTVLIFLLISTRWATHRYLYIALPVMIFIITTTILNLLNFLIFPITASVIYRKIAIVLFISIILLINSASFIRRELLNTVRDYSCLECLPGIQVGRWLEKNFPSNTKILWDQYEYIPYRFNNIFLLQTGDPQIHLNKFNPDIVIIQGWYIRYVNSLPDEDYDEIYFVKSRYPKRFYADLMQKRLPYNKIVLFGSQEANNDILVFAKAE